ncbi:MAG: RING finger domain-containing protein [Candidatus Hermodarchaeota archaeon]
MERFKYCPYCGKRFIKQNSIHRNFCSYCGKNLNKSFLYSIKRISCTICHESMTLNHDKIFKCPYCGSQFHQNCISSWLYDYNSCPLCLNSFLMPKTISVENRR